MLKDKNILITGASSGIGLASIKNFLEQGAKVIGVGNACEKFKTLGEEFTFFECNVTNEEEIEAVCHQVADKFEKLDGLVTICDRDYAATIKTIDSKIFNIASRHIVMAPMLFTKGLEGVLKKSDKPCIIYNLSVEGLTISSNSLVSSLNTAMLSYVRQAVPQLAPIRVNAVAYGLIEGHLLEEKMVERLGEGIESVKIPAKRLGLPKDVANVNSFLLSDKATYFNGAIIQADGGFYTQNPRSMGCAY